MRLEKTDKRDSDGYVIYQFIYNSPLDEATWQLRKYEHIKEVRRSECILVPKEEARRIDEAIEHWRRRLVDLKSFNIPGWDLI